MPCWLLLAASALASGTAPDDRVEVSAETGAVTGLGAVAFGVGGGWRRGGITVVGTGSFGGRTDFLEGPDHPGYGLGSLAVAWDTDAGSMRVGLVALADGVVLDADEQECSRRFGCQHQFFVGMEGPPGLGFGVQPAGGLRVSGTGASGASFSMTLALQPTTIMDVTYWYQPRLDLAVWSARNNVSIHTWAGRYGAAVGIGYRVSSPPQ